jgi:hypothetical protein
MNKVQIAWLVLLLCIAIILVFLYSRRERSRYYGSRYELIRETREGFEGPSDPKEDAGVLQPVDNPSIQKILGIIQRMTSVIMQPAFFSDAMRKSGMTPTELARDYIQSQKAAQIE